MTWREDGSTWEPIPFPSLTMRGALTDMESDRQSWSEVAELTKPQIYHLMPPSPPFPFENSHIFPPMYNQIAPSLTFPFANPLILPPLAPDLSQIVGMSHLYCPPVTIDLSQLSTNSSPENPPNVPVETKKALTIECPVCFEPPTLPVATQCGHVFCKDCLLKSLRYNPSCPICKRKFSVRRSKFIRLYV